VAAYVKEPGWPESSRRPGENRTRAQNHLGNRSLPFPFRLLPPSFPLSAFRFHFQQSLSYT
jgi:hypothetical protein